MWCLGKQGVKTRAGGTWSRPREKERKSELQGRTETIRGTIKQRDNEGREAREAGAVREQRDLEILVLVVQLRWLEQSGHPRRRLVLVLRLLRLLLGLVDKQSVRVFSILFHRDCEKGRTRGQSPLS